MRNFGARLEAIEIRGVIFEFRIQTSKLKITREFLSDARNWRSLACFVAKISGAKF
jgi:hypothetical protein